MEKQSVREMKFSPIERAVIGGISLLVTPIYLAAELISDLTLRRVRSLEEARRLMKTGIVVGYSMSLNRRKTALKTINNLAEYLETNKY